MKVKSLTLSQMIENFDISRVSLGGPIFDVEKLRWLNGLWVRENLDATQFVDRIKGWLLNNPKLNDLIPHIQSRVDTFSDIAPMASFMLSGMLPISVEDFNHKKLEQSEVKRILQFILWRLEAQRDWTKENIFA